MDGTVQHKDEDTSKNCRITKDRIKKQLIAEEKSRLGEGITVLWVRSDAR